MQKLSKQSNKSLVGQVFTWLIVIKDSGRRNSCGHIIWECMCKCGNKTLVATHSLKNDTYSCGCYQKSKVTKHGLEKHPLYPTWHTMIARCYNKSSSSYSEYGGRGIKVDERWHNVINFINDMHPKPKNTSLDRTDNLGNYSKENCRWSTFSEQSYNRRNNDIITYKNKSLPLGKWAKELGINRSTLTSRLYQYNWSVEKSFETPVISTDKWAKKYA